MPKEPRNYKEKPATETEKKSFYRKNRHADDIALDDEIDQVHRKQTKAKTLVVPELQFTQEANPRAVFNLVPLWLKACTRRVTLANPDLWAKSEADLQEALFGENVPDPTSNKLRIAFWEEYERTQREGLPELDLERVIRGVCSMKFLQEKFTKSDLQVAWLFHPPTEYKLDLRDLQHLSLKALRKIMAMPATNPDGTPNVKLIETQLKIFQHVDMRLEGAIIQRIDQRNLNVNVNADEKKGQAVEAKNALSMSEIDEKLKLLERRSKALTAPAIIQVDLMKEVSPVIIEPGETSTERDGD